jgi:rhodanese-related sulfurtransferase
MSARDVPAVSPQEAAARLADGSGALLVDVREPHEFGALRVDGAVLLPISRFGVAFRELPTDRPLLLFCRSGNRSAMATDFLRQHGFPDAHNVTGGILAWRAAGLPVRSGPVGPGEGSLPGRDGRGP